MHSRLELEDDVRLTALARRLRELPSEARPPYDWLEFERRAARHREQSAAHLSWRHAALAAGVAFTIVSIAMWTRLADRSTVRPTAPVTATAAGHSSQASAPRSMGAAGWLESLPDEPAVLRVDTHLGVMDLEDSIAWVDELLTMERAGAAPPDRLAALQRERSRLVDSLVHVRYAETLAAELP